MSKIWLRAVELTQAHFYISALNIVSFRISKAVGVFMILFTLLYFFSAVGVALYGGLVSRDPDNPLSYLILGTDFSDNEYWANNFNDMVSAMNVLFNLLVVNNWTECEIGYEAVTQSKWVRLYFLAFHVLGVILINNLVVAFIINAFLQQLAKFREHVGEEIVDGEAVIRDRRAVFDASVVTGTKTGLSGGFIARYRRSHSDGQSDGQHEQDRLRQLFTQRSGTMEIPISDHSAP